MTTSSSGVENPGEGAPVIETVPAAATVTPDAQEQAVPGTIPPDQRTRLTALIAVLAYLAYDLLIPLVPYHPRALHFGPEFLFRWVFFHILPTVVFMLLQIWLAYCLVRLRWTPRAAGIVVIASVVLWVVLFQLDRNASHFGPSFLRIVVQTGPTLFGLVLTVGLTAFGTQLARIVREPNVLLPVAAIAMPVDYVGAMTPIGFTNTVTQKHMDVVSRVSVHVPHLSGLHILGLIGPGDALFVAFFFAVVLRLGMNMRGTFWWTFSLLTLAMVEVLTYGIAIAALVPMGFAVIAANWRYFHLKRDEVFAMLYAAVIVSAVVGTFYAVSHRLLTQGH